MEVDLGPGHIVLDGVPAAHERGTAAPLFSAHVCCGNGHPSHLLLSSCFTLCSLLFLSGNAREKSIDGGSGCGLTRYGGLGRVTGEITIATAFVLVATVTEIVEIGVVIEKIGVAIEIVVRSAVIVTSDITQRGYTKLLFYMSRNV